MTLTAPPAHPSRREQRRRARWRVPVLPAIVAVLLIAGVVTVMYPTIAAWINQYQQSQIIAQYSDGVQQLPQDGLRDAFERAQEYNTLLTGGATVGSYRNVPEADGDVDESLDYRSQLSADATGLMARIKIPSIAVDLPVYHGTSDATLLQGVGHLEGTALPVGGDSTHSVLTAHRGLAQAELFTNLDRVEVGDTFVVEVFGEVLTYRVRQTQVVEPSETEQLFPVAGEDLVTLVTCTPLGINTQRILVTGERILPTPIEDVQALGSRPDVPGFPWWIFVVSGTLIAAVVYVWLMGRPRRARAASDSSAVSGSAPE